MAHLPGFTAGMPHLNFTAAMFLFLLGLILYFLVILAERALVNLTPHELDQLSLDESASAQRAHRLGQEGIRPALASLLLARLLLQVMVIVLGVAMVFGSGAVQDALANAAGQLGWSGSLVWGIAALILALLLAAFFVSIQKIDIQKNRSSRAIFLVKRLGRFIVFWKMVFRPLVKETKTDSDDEKDVVQEAGSSTNNREKREIELLKSIVKFSDVTVKQVMQPRTKVVGVEFKTDFHDLLSIVRESEFSRLPVYNDDLDYVTGILYVKDLLTHLDAPADYEWQPLIRTNVMLVPESKRCSELLEEFKQQKIHMAIVVDEYGGSAGIVTMEDILEEVTGDIRDEFDEESEIRYRKIDEFTYLFEGQTLLNDVCRIAGIASSTFDSVRGNSDTLAGLILELRGDIPKAGVETLWNNYLFTVTAADNRRIAQIKLGLPSSGA